MFVCVHVCVLMHIYVCDLLDWITSMAEVVQHYWQTDSGAEGNLVVAPCRRSQSGAEGPEDSGRCTSSPITSGGQRWLQYQQNVAWIEHK